MKLSEYYAHEGVNDPIVVEIPKGSYALTFHAAHGYRSVTAICCRASPRAHRAKGLKPGPLESCVGRFVVVVLLAAAGLFFDRECNPAFATYCRSTGYGPRLFRRAYQLFWNRFVTGPQQPWVIFSNGSFVGRPETGMRYFNPTSDAHVFHSRSLHGCGRSTRDPSTGPRLFICSTARSRVKRGALFSLDDAKNNDLIFVGSPSENLTLMDLPGTHEFIFQRLDSGPRKGDLGRPQRASAAGRSEDLSRNSGEPADHRRLCRSSACCPAWIRPAQF